MRKPSVRPLQKCRCEEVIADESNGKGATHDGGIRDCWSGVRDLRQPEREYFAAARASRSDALARSQSQSASTTPGGLLGTPATCL